MGTEAVLRCSRIVTDVVWKGTVKKLAPNLPRCTPMQCLDPFFMIRLESGVVWQLFVNARVIRALV